MLKIVGGAVIGGLILFYVIAFIREIVAFILKVFAYFAVIGAFFLAVVLFIVIADPLVHRVAVWLGPQIVEDYVTTFIGFGVFILPIAWCWDSMTGWKVTIWAFRLLRKLSVEMASRFSFSPEPDRDPTAAAVVEKVRPRRKRAQAILDRYYGTNTP